MTRPSNGKLQRSRQEGSGMAAGKAKDGPGQRGTRGLEQVRALSHPLRLKLLEIFAARACTTMQAAERLGESPTRLYYHVAALERAGLVRLTETRRNRGATEKYYKAVSQTPYSRERTTGFLQKGGPRGRAARG